MLWNLLLYDIWCLKLFNNEILLTDDALVSPWQLVENLCKTTAQPHHILHNYSHQTGIINWAVPSNEKWFHRIFWSNFQITKYFENTRILSGEYFEKNRIEHYYVFSKYCMHHITFEVHITATFYCYIIINLI